MLFFNQKKHYGLNLPNHISAQFTNVFGVCTTVNYTNVYAIRNINKAARLVTPLHLGVVSANKNIVMVAVI